ncbi:MULTISPECIES: endonuclease/exonuclease/phosphatase family protein [Paracoccus]|uniref:endonuclease/exonuclease/phosphatase family protein n=1 Tax=Paracoccus TaxID=265 RepID=UPI001FB74F38|nr:MULTISPECIES: endonuclease/exonuclease/phosphatase family protein [Paracoccus]MCJ1898790.1 endonuclease/exonuclease/phosphatase family protein [Paracoccus versutus]MDF3903195.1 endonuclease/exonuclease/phosphatase family protein [Paracoccus sp. AS002]WGR60967.1 endonuclease/exonuclease/phosphatase family protein [Paracoccus ferrooxidans]
MGVRLLAGAALLAALGLAAQADPLRIATFSPDLSRDGPGLLLRDLGRKDAQIDAVVQVLAETRPDILLLTHFDWDYKDSALDAFAARLAQAGLDYPHRFAARPNSGMATGLDLNADGRLGTADDAQGFGTFSGQGGMAILSRHPIGPVKDYTDFLWRDLPDNLMPPLPEEVAAIRRLSSTAHWDAVVTVAGRPLHLLAMSATPPVFDGPEDLNGRRNHDELAFWLHHLPDGPFVLAGNLNLDPLDSEGRPEALARIMAHVTDPLPRSAGGAAAKGGVNDGHRGDPALDTGDWPDDKPPGNLRVDYVLPARPLKVLDSGVFWPAEGPLAKAALAASAHRLVWVDLDWPPAP